MYTLKIENKRGETITLTDDPNYVATINGLESLKAVINTSRAGLMDGTLFNSSAMSERALTLTIMPMEPVEKNRIALYRLLQVKQYCKVYYSNGSRDVYIEGYVESIENDLFTQSQEIQFSIICPQPYLSGLYYITADLNKILRLFEFPCAIDKKGIEFSRIQRDYMATIQNKGDAESGVIIVITAKGNVTNPVIYNPDTGGSFKVTITRQESDQLMIWTVSGDKWVRYIHEGVASNAINKVAPSPEWFVLTAGDNIFSYDAVSGADNMSIYFMFKYKYIGV